MSEEFEREVEIEMARLDRLERLNKPVIADDIPDSPVKPLVETIVTGEEKDDE